MAVEMSFDKEDSMRGFSFMDQCRIICLNYISKYSESILLSATDTSPLLHNLHNISSKELSGFAQNEGSRPEVSICFFDIFISLILFYNLKCYIFLIAWYGNEKHLNTLQA